MMTNPVVTIKMENGDVMKAEDVYKRQQLHQVRHLLGLLKNSVKM